MPTQERIAACLSACEGIPDDDLPNAFRNAREQDSAIRAKTELNIVTRECDLLRSQKAELVAALEKFSHLDTNVPSGTWAVDRSYCDQARAAIAKARQS